MDAINKPEARHAALLQISNEIRIIDCLATECARRHSALGEKAINFGAEGFCMGHALYNIGYFLDCKRKNPIRVKYRKFPTIRQ